MSGGQGNKMQAAMQNKGVSGQFGDMFNMRQAQNNPHMQQTQPTQQPSQGGGQSPMTQWMGQQGQQQGDGRQAQMMQLRQQMGQQQQPRQMQGNVGQQFRGQGGMMAAWQPRGLQQAWQGVNNPQQFAQWQAQQQQALRSGQQGLIANHQQGIPAQQAAGQAMRPVIDTGMMGSPSYLG